METTRNETENTTSVFIHLSTFLQYFFPFANFIAPLIIWTINKEKAFVDYNGKQALNFQLSILTYKIIVGLICVPFIIYFAVDILSLFAGFESSFSTMDFQLLSGILIFLAVLGTVFLSMFIFELVVVINASIHASKGLYYKYPLSIQFFKTKKANSNVQYS